MPGWDDAKYEMQGEDFDGGPSTVVGVPETVRMQDGVTRGGLPVGPQLAMTIRRTDTMTGKDIPWSWGVSGAKERDNWSIQGTRAVHAEGKKLNASTDLGKLFKSVKEHLPYLDGFDELDAKSWEGLASLGDIEWGWLEEANRVQDEKTGKWSAIAEYVKAADGKLVKNPDYKPKRTMVVVGYEGEGSANGQVFDLAGIPAELVTSMRDAVANVPAGDKNALFAALGTVPGAFNVQAVTGALAGDATAEALRVALVDF